MQVLPFTDAGPLHHSQIEYDDGTNSGYFPSGVGEDSEAAQLECPGPHYRDDLIRQAEESLKHTNEWDANDYNLFFHNCHDYSDAVLDEYERLNTGGGGGY